MAEAIREASSHDAPAPVQHEQRVRIPESRDDTGKGVRTASIHGTCDETGDDAGVAGPAEIDEPDSVGDLSLEGARDLERQTALADARGPGKGHEPVFAQQLGDVARAVPRGRRTTLAAWAGCRGAARPRPGRSPGHE